MCKERNDFVLNDRMRGRDRYPKAEAVRSTEHCEAILRASPTSKLGIGTAAWDRLSSFGGGWTARLGKGARHVALKPKAWPAHCPWCLMSDQARGLPAHAVPCACFWWKSG